MCDYCGCGEEDLCPSCGNTPCVCGDEDENDDDFDDDDDDEM